MQEPGYKATKILQRYLCEMALSSPGDSVHTVRFVCKQTWCALFGMMVCAIWIFHAHLRSISLDNRLHAKRANYGLSNPVMHVRAEGDRSSSYGRAKLN